MNIEKTIETPEEKAQREEDEFVKLMIDLASESQLMSCGFKDGVISAYRKLKEGVICTRQDTVKFQIVAGSAKTLNLIPKMNIRQIITTALLA